MPDNGNWEWDGEWTIDVATSTDADGWTYAKNFDSKFQNKNQSYHYVRRRKWIRISKCATADKC